MEGPELEQKIGVFKVNDDGECLLSGKKYFTPNDANNFKKSEEGEFCENGGFKEGRIEFEPNDENGFIASIEGDFDENGRLRKGVAIYSKSTCSNLGVLNWTIGRFGSYPSALNCFGSEEGNQVSLINGAGYEETEV